MAYSNKTNSVDYKFDLNQDLDDGTFLRKSDYSSSTDYNKPSSAIADFERKQQLLLKQKAHLEESCLSSTKNSMMLLNESEQIGVKTAVELVEQREKLDRIDNHLDVMHHVTKQSEKDLKNINAPTIVLAMKSIFGLFKKDKDKDAKPEVQAKLTSSQSANNFKEPSHLNNTVNKLRSNSTHYDSGPLTKKPETIFEDEIRPKANESKKKDFNAQLDENLLAMQSGIGRLKDLALGLGRELDEQNEIFDSITQKSERQNLTIQSQNKAMLKNLGRKA